MILKDLIILIPSFNEEENLSYILNEVIKYVPREYIILADDGSTDRTIQIAKEYRIRIIRSKLNVGKGFILKNAFEAIIKYLPNIKWIVTLDADGQHNPKDLLSFSESIKNDNEICILIGRRDYRKMPKFNFISNILTSNWCKFWLQWKLDDLQCGYRCYNTKKLEKILYYGVSRKNFDFETEILFVAWFLDMKIKELPVQTVYFQRHRKSRVLPSIDTLRWIWLIISFGLNVHFMRKILLKKGLIRT